MRPRSRDYAAVPGFSNDNAWRGALSGATRL
jgi:hypothetical protein